MKRELLETEYVDTPDGACDDGPMVDASPPITQLRISLLGGARIEVAPGVEVDPGPQKCQELLAALALDPQVAITVRRLIDLLWHENPPRTAEKTLQTYVARLRKALGPETIVRTGAAYRLDVDPLSIDTSRFRLALRRGDVQTALTEWTGTPLAGIETDGLRPLLDGLIEEWLDAVEADLHHAVETDPGAATGRLTELVAAHPFREEIWALLMTALYRTGRQAEALDAYRRARTSLVDSLGVEPGPRLRQLEQLILRQDDQLSAVFEPRRIGAADRVAPTGTVTFGFVELDDVARLWSTHPTDAADVISAFEELARTLATEHGGLVFSTGVETLGASFDSATDGGAWALALHGQVTDHRWPHGESVGIRIGLHTGEADERNGSYYGPTVTLANRLATLGHPGQTLATTVTALLCGQPDQQDLGPFAIDGVQGEQALHQIGPGSFSPLRITTAQRDQLPRPTNRLIGRDDLVSNVGAALRESQLVTLVGPGGVGKTRLALEVARRDREASRDGVWFVGLAEVTESIDVTRAVADAIGVQETSERSVIETVVGALRAQTGLVVLDNCEHVIQGASELVSIIVQRCPDLTVLATSREGLGVAAERMIAVGPLDISGSSVDLFAERARTADPGFDLESQRTTIEAVCRRLDGVPLAIELAAARVRSLSPADLLARLEDSFRLLTGARRGAVERHRTLRATIQWSYDLLSEQQRRLFRRLAVFSGPFDLHAAEQVVADADLPVSEVSSLIGDLVDQSMCVVESGTSGRRFRLLEPMRQFAMEEFGFEESDHDLRQRHAVHIRDEASRIRELLTGDDEITGAAELNELWPNLRSALDWAIDQRDLELATGLVGPIVSQGFLRRGLGELRDWIERVMEIAGPADAETIAEGLLWTALSAQLTENRADFDRLVERFGEPDLIFAKLARAMIDGDTDGIVDTVPDAIAEARRREDVPMACLFEVLAAGIQLSAGRLDEAEAHAKLVMDRTESPLPPTLLNWLLYIAASVRAIRGDATGADELYDQIVAMPLPPRTNSPNETLAARRASRQGDHRTAYSIMRRHIDELLEANNLNGAGVVALEFLNIMVATDQLNEAAFVLGYFQTSGILDVEGQGFSTLLVEPSNRVAADPAAAELRDKTAAQDLNPAEVLKYMAGTLDSILAR